MNKEQAPASNVKLTQSGISMEMKNHLAILLFSVLMTMASCYGNKMIEKPGDAKRLETHKEQFIGKPLKVLLKQIKPQLKFVWGNPENTWAEATGGTYFEFHFVDREGYGALLNKKQKPLGIM